MCVGEVGTDTISLAECERLRVAAVHALPAHHFGIHANEEGLTWVVLEPAGCGALRFTICRVAPCLVILAEDRLGRRQICSAQNVADAIAFVRSATDQAILAADGNAHPLHPVMQ